MRRQRSNSGRQKNPLQAAQQTLYAPDAVSAKDRGKIAIRKEYFVRELLF
jgi:hypothetical protein